MAVRVEVGFRDGVSDPKGDKVAREARELIGASVHSVRTVFVYTLDMELSPERLEEVAAGPFTDPVIQEYSIGAPLRKEFLPRHCWPIRRPGPCRARTRSQA